MTMLYDDELIDAARLKQFVEDKSGLSGTSSTGGSISFEKLRQFIEETRTDIEDYDVGYGEGFADGINSNLDALECLIVEIEKQNDNHEAEEPKEKQ